MPGYLLPDLERNVLVAISGVWLRCYTDADVDNKASIDLWGSYPIFLSWSHDRISMKLQWATLHFDLYLLRRFADTSAILYRRL